MDLRPFVSSFPPPLIRSKKGKAQMGLPATGGPVGALASLPPDPLVVPSVFTHISLASRGPMQGKGLSRSAVGPRGSAEFLRGARGSHVGLYGRASQARTKVCEPITADLPAAQERRL